MQFSAKDLLTLEPDDTPKDSSATRAERASLTADLAAESLRLSGRLRMRVHGESMLPTLWPGDVVEIGRCPLEDVRVGDVVLAGRAGRFFLHRLVARSAAGDFVLRGDSMPAADPEFKNAELLGRLAGFPRRLGVWSWVIGRLLCYCKVARRLALKLHARRKPAEASAVGAIRPVAAARGRGRPRYTNPTPAPQSILELPRAGS